MAVPMKFRELGDFHAYYSGVEVAPYITIFVGGNHEASNHNFELFYGGWVAPNIYYMGAANVLRLGSLRIAGLSGIWKGYNYRKPHYERLPYSSDDVRSAYHVREYDVRKLLQLATQVDIGISHDWPNGVEWLGNYKWLFQKKDLFEKDAREGQLGSIAGKAVLQHLRPPYWFSAHLHIKYAAVVDHNRPWPENAPLTESQGRASSYGASQNYRNGVKALDAGQTSAITTVKDATTTNQDEIDLDMDGDDETAPGKTLLPQVEPVSNTAEIDLDLDSDTDQQVTRKEPSRDNNHHSALEDLRALLPAAFAKPPQPTQEPDPPTTITNTTTKFLSLDKCLPRRDFLQILEIPAHNQDEASALDPTQPLPLTYDPEWLAITRVFAADLPIGSVYKAIPCDMGKAHYAPLVASELAWINENIPKDKLKVPRNFVLTAPVHDASADIRAQAQPREHSNPQTEAFCELLQIPNPFKLSEEQIEANWKKGPPASENRGGFRGGRGGGGARGARGGQGERGGRGRGGRGRGRY
jgi:lariat debranching enzyme